tara:strand:+ start:3523 stop:4287 length:765 start_codon:yes stop_codon:yes gene_type:complete
MRDFSGFTTRFNWPDIAGGTPLCIGHRGASGHTTENTLAGFRLASALGAQMWELDTQLTRDGVVVVSHDDHLLRVFGVDAFISALSADQLADLEGVAVPTFAEVAALARELGAGLYIELKAAGSGPKCWHELLQHDQTFAVLGSFDTAQLRQLRDMGCGYPLAVLVRVGADPLAFADMASADIAHLCWERDGARPQDKVTPQLREAIFASRREIVLWHEERADILADIMAMPVLGICTDLPDLMRPKARAIDHE